MALPAQNTAPQLVAAAGQTVFPFSWRCDDSGTVLVWVNDTQVGGSTVALNADQTAAPGGSITLAAGATLGDIITVERQTPQTQVLALTAYNPFTAIAMIQALDRIVEMLQELWARVTRAITVKRSDQPTTSSFELPSPQSTGLPIGWKTDDAGAHWHLDNISLPASITGVTAPGTWVRNEVPAGAVSSTTGSDGNGAFTFAHAPISAAHFDILVDGIRQPPSRYVRVGAVVTFNATFFPIVGADVRGDYVY